VIQHSVVQSSAPQGRVINAVALEKAVLCAECDVVSDSPSDTCLVCGSRSLFNISRVFGGNLPKERASLIHSQPVEIASPDVVLAFPKPHRLRRKSTAGFRQLLAVAENESDETNCGVLLGPQGR